MQSATVSEMLWLFHQKTDRYQPAASGLTLEEETGSPEVSTRNLARLLEGDRLYRQHHVEAGPGVDPFPQLGDAPCPRPQPDSLNLLHPNPRHRRAAGAQGWAGAAKSEQCERRRQHDVAKRKRAGRVESRLTGICNRKYSPKTRHLQNEIYVFRAESSSS